MSYPYNLNDLISREVRRQVGSEVSKQLQPSFFDAIIQNHLMQVQIANSVSAQLPNALHNSLQSNSGLVASFVQTQLPVVLGQQHYYLDGLTKQRDDFNASLQKQEQTYIAHHQKNMVDLRDASTDLIKKNIKHISKQDVLLTQIQTNINEESKGYIDDKLIGHTNELTNDINRKIRWGMVGSGLCGTVLGFGLSFFVRR